MVPQPHVLALPCQPPVPLTPVSGSTLLSLETSKLTQRFSLNSFSSRSASDTISLSTATFLYLPFHLPCYFPSNPFLLFLPLNLAALPI